MGRRRRSAEEAKAQIMDATEKALMARGPEAIRLSDIASELGVSRQAILHHYGSREDLLRAVVQKAWLRLFQDVIALAQQVDTLSPHELVDVVDASVRLEGNARLGAWLNLSGQGLPDSVLANTLSDLPPAVAKHQGSDERNTQYSLMLVASALMGDAIFGERLRLAFGLQDSEEQREHFRHWVADKVFADRT